MNDEMMWKMKRMQKMQQVLVLESIAVSLMAMVLIFGLGFIVPSINPYIVIKWIVYVTAVYFVYAVIGNWFRRAFMMMKWRKMEKSGWVEESDMVSKSKKTSKRSK